MYLGPNRALQAGYNWTWVQPPPLLNRMGRKPPPPDESPPPSPDAEAAASVPTTTTTTSRTRVDVFTLYVHGVGNLLGALLLLLLLRFQAFALFCTLSLLSFSVVTKLRAALYHPPPPAAEGFLPSQSRLWWRVAVPACVLLTNAIVVSTQHSTAPLASVGLLSTLQQQQQQRRRGSRSKNARLSHQAAGSAAAHADTTDAGGGGVHSKYQVCCAGPTCKVCDCSTIAGSCCAGCNVEREAGQLLADDPSLASSSRRSSRTRKAKHRKHRGTKRSRTQDEDRTAMHEKHEPMCAAWCDNPKHTWKTKCKWRSKACATCAECTTASSKGGGGSASTPRPRTSLRPIGILPPPGAVSNPTAALGTTAGTKRAIGVLPPPSE